MDERSQKAFEFLSDATKQQITLSTGIVALTVGFAKDLLQGVPDWARLYLQVSWVSLTVCIVAGVFVLFSLTGKLGSDRFTTITYSEIYGCGTRFFSGLQWIAFLVGIVAVVAFGWQAFRVAPIQLKDTPQAIQQSQSRPTLSVKPPPRTTTPAVGKPRP